MAAQLRFSPLPKLEAGRIPAGIFRLPAGSPRFSLPRSSSPNLSQSLTTPDLPAFTGGGINNNHNGSSGSGGGGGGGGNEDHSHPSDPPSSSGAGGGPLGAFLEGWRSRVSADPEFPFKVVMEEVVGVSSNCLGDMASRPNFGLHELDLVFSTLVVGSIVNFVLMYLLAPTSASPSSPAASHSLPSHLFEPGPFSPLDRAATLIYKGAAFAAVGFAAGLAGTAISNGLIAARKRVDPEFETPNKAPPTVLNALTWALHMGVSSNLRYQTLNGVEFAMAGAVPAAGFKAAVVVLRCLNNVLGGMSFVALARLTGSQKTVEEKGLLIGGELESSSESEAKE